MSRILGRRPRRAKPRICLVVRFPDSTEIRYLERPPSPGTRMRSAAGKEWFVAEALQSGRDTYTVFCVGRREYLDDIDAVSARTRVLADDLLNVARRSAGRRSGAASAVDEHVGTAGSSSGRKGGRLTPYIASVIDSDGRLLEYVIQAPSREVAEAEAREGARQWETTLIAVRSWDDPIPGSTGWRAGLARLHSLVRRRVPLHT
jgi:hypothetical protein